MHLIELLKLRGFDDTAKTKLVRHQSTDCDLDELMITGLIETYQAIQPKSILECEYMVSCIGLPYNRARFLGLYKVQWANNRGRRHLT